MLVFREVSCLFLGKKPPIFLGAVIFWEGNPSNETLHKVAISSRLVVLPVVDLESGRPAFIRHFPCQQCGGTSSRERPWVKDDTYCDVSTKWLKVKNQGLVT